MFSILYSCLRNYASRREHAEHAGYAHFVECALRGRATRLLGIPLTQFIWSAFRSLSNFYFSRSEEEDLTIKCINHFANQLVLDRYTDQVFLSSVILTCVFTGFDPRETDNP
jgi:hypothetical protein